MDLIDKIQKTPLYEHIFRPNKLTDDKKQMSLVFKTQKKIHRNQFSTIHQLSKDYTTPTDRCGKLHFQILLPRSSRRKKKNAIEQKSRGADTNGRQ
ncbi:hypothetical protein CEXT_243111 [Caerostris extrusa]|uniref:Uncharacterized protein n=1 Tax=Caerostris extrusa TaxID=172846 RepID=A0AAV4S248_CAEEX|nr:hypothetical protein CEXT_243111 [Caerostris extrusa]